MSRLERFARAFHRVMHNNIELITLAAIVFFVFYAGSQGGGK